MHADLRPRVGQYVFALGLAVALAACAIDSDPSSGVDERPTTSALQADVSLAPPPPDPKFPIFLCPTTLVCSRQNCADFCDVDCLVRVSSCP